MWLVLRCNNPGAQETLDLKGAPVGEHYKCTCIGTEAERASFTKKEKVYFFPPKAMASYMGKQINRLLSKQCSKGNDSQLKSKTIQNKEHN